MPVESDGISPIICHPDLPHQLKPGKIVAVVGSELRSQNDRGVCTRPTCRSDAGPAFAVAQSDFPSPTIVVGQLNDGVFNSLVFHPGPSALRGRQIRRYGCTVCSLVYLAMRNGTEIRVSTSAPPNTVKAGRETTHHFKTGRSATPVNFTLTKLHQHQAQMRRNRSSAGPAVA